MKLCVITDDNMISVDGEPLNFTFAIDSNIWAIQWDGVSGHIEYKDITAQNEEITDITQFQSLVDAHAAEKQRIADERAAEIAAEEAERLAAENPTP